MAERTPGPWRWELNMKSRTLRLCGGVPAFDLTVMDFVRWGMNGAMPRFRLDRDRLNIMRPVHEFGAIQPGREHHESWFRLVNHPDARLIAAAPELLEACKAMADELAGYADAGQSNKAFHLCEQARAIVAQAEGEG